MGRGSCPGTRSPWAGFYGVLRVQTRLALTGKCTGDFSIQGGLALSSAVFPCCGAGSGGAGEVISVPGLHPTVLKGGPCQQVFFPNTWWCWVGAWT